MKALPQISICIPVFNTEPTLAECIRSATEQDFENFEIIVVNDGSTGTDSNGRECKKIVKLAQKECNKFRKTQGLSKIQIKYLEHKSNLALVEARRTAVESATGEYICCVDSDDTLMPGALSSLYNAAIQENADIVQGKTNIIDTHKGDIPQEQIDNRLSQINKRYNNVFIGTLQAPQIFNGYLAKHNHVGILWAKLIRRELYLEALANIPFTKCVMCEDFLQYFFISLKAKKYVGIDKAVYNYSADTGISSNTKIDTLERWEQVCSTANVFTIIFSAIKEIAAGTFSPEQMDALRLQSRSYLVINLQQLKKNVIPELQEQALDLLYDYWGKDFVEIAQKHLQDDLNN